MSTDEFIKFVPDAVIVKVLEPALILLGEIEISDGIGLLPTALMVKTTEPEVPPPGAGVLTVILAEPAMATSELFTVAES